MTVTIARHVMYLPDLNGSEGVWGEIMWVFGCCIHSRFTADELQDAFKFLLMGQGRLLGGDKYIS